MNSVWSKIIFEAKFLKEKDHPVIQSVLDDFIFKHESFASSVSFILASFLNEKYKLDFYDLFFNNLKLNKKTQKSIEKDLSAFVQRDPATDSMLVPYLYYKGFHSIALHRISHILWQDKKQMLALFLQSEMSKKFGVDIHPAVIMGDGIFIDHATGVVIGETATLEKGVSIMQGVTLGGIGNQIGDRHPKVGKNVLIGAGAKVLGNINIGDCAKIAASSVVLKDVEALTTVAGIPAKKVGSVKINPAINMDHRLKDECR